MTWERFAQRKEGAVLPGLSKLQAGGQAAAEPEHTAPHPKGRHRSGASLLPAAGRRARAWRETREKINKQRNSKLPKMTHSVGSTPLPLIQAFVQCSWIFENNQRSGSSTSAGRAAWDSSSLCSRLPLCGPRARTANPPKTKPIGRCLRWAWHPCPSSASRAVAAGLGLAHLPNRQPFFKLNNVSRRKIPLKYSEIYESLLFVSLLWIDAQIKLMPSPPPGPLLIKHPFFYLFHRIINQGTAWIWLRAAWG